MFTKNMNILVILLIFVLSAQSIGQQVSVTSLQFLKINPSARIIGMGDAGAALADNSEAVFINPAGLAYVNHFDINFDHIDWFLDVKLDGGAIAYSLGNLGTIAFHSLYVNYGDFDETTVANIEISNGETNPGLTGRVLHPYALLSGISYARALTSQFSFGITAKYVTQNLVMTKVSSMAFDAGLVYDTQFKSIKVGIALRNLGPEVTYVEKAYPLPQAISVGISTAIIGPQSSILSGSDSHKLIAVLDFLQPRDYDQQYNLGLEYSLHSLLFIRGGYKFNYDEESFTIGAGIIYQGIRFDYSYNDFGHYLQSVHRFTVAFSK